MKLLYGENCMIHTCNWSPVRCITVNIMYWSPVRCITVNIMLMFCIILQPAVKITKTAVFDYKH